MENDVIMRYLGVDYCPSNIGCRVKESFYASKGTIQAYVRKPRKRDLAIVSPKFQEITGVCLLAFVHEFVITGVCS